MNKSGIAACLVMVGCAAACSGTEPGAGEGTPADPAASSPPATRGEVTAAAVLRQSEVRKRIASDPIGAVAVARLHQQRDALGLDRRHSFEVASVNTDGLGSKHVRFIQRYEGVRIVDSTVISHVGANGEATGDTLDAVRRSVALSTVPRLDAKRALERVATHPAHTRPYLVEPKSELVIEPVQERFVKATGLRVTGEEQGLNAVDVERRVTSYRLVYQIETLEADPGGPTQSMRYRVDADTGAVLEAKSATKANDNFGKAFATKTVANGGVVPITTTPNATLPEVLSNPRSSARNFGVWDDDFCQLCGPNIFFTLNGAGLNGDGQVFAGDATASENNRRTAVVDVLYGMQVTWDMFSRVYGRGGYDGALYRGDAYVHVSTDWDDAHYTPSTGNIEVGDGTPPLPGKPNQRSNRTTLNTIAHEFTHGVVDFTAQLDGTNEGYGLNEGFADIFGEVAEAWEAGKGQPLNLTSIPAAPGADFFSTGSNRDLVRPGGPRIWTAALGAYPDVHDRGMPIGHAFFYLSQGAVSDPGQPDQQTGLRTSFSPFIPWGMQGIGTDAAAKIFNLALTGFMGSSSDYAATREACLIASFALFGANSTQANAVANAFAAINVGAPAAGYPGSSSIAEPRGNEVMEGAPAVVPVSPPAGAPLLGPLSKRVTISGSVTTGDKDDWYFVYVPAGKQLRATLTPTVTDDDLFLWQASELQRSTHNNAQEDQITQAAQPAGHAYYLRVSHFRDLVNGVVLPVAPYRLDVDLL